MTVTCSFWKFEQEKGDGWMVRHMLREKIKAILSLIMLVTASVCRSAEGDGKLAFLWCRPGFDRGTQERRVEDANFSVKLVSYWNEKPAVKSFDSRFGIEKHAQYRFMGPCKTQWLAVEYMRLDMETPVAKDIETWVKAGLMLVRKIDLMEPDGVEFKLLSMTRVPQPDKAFVAKHKADMMCSFLGTIRIGEQYHRFFIVCLNRGRESWKVVKVFPAHPPDGCTEEKACQFDGSDLMIGGLFIGNFRILSDRKLPAFPHVPAKPRTGAMEKGDVLLAAIRGDDVAKVRQCLESGADPNYRGSRKNTPLGVAVGDIQKEPNPEIVEMLLKRGADPKALWGTCGTTPFFSLVQNSAINDTGSVVLSNQIAAVRILLKYGADPNKEQGLFRKSALGYAVMRHGNLELIKALVEGGAVITDKIIDEAKNDATKTYLLQHRKGAKRDGSSMEGFADYRRQAEKGDSVGQYNLGVRYMKGDGVEKDMAEAYKWFRLSALQGFADAEFCVALCLASGSGVRQDGEEALVWLRRAADKGHKMAKEQLRAMEKPSKPQTRTLKVKETLMAADRGDAQAQYDMGFLYSRGVGVEKDDVKAAAYYRKAAEQGFMLAQHNLACCYMTGQGVEKNYAEAQKLFVKAAEQGDLEAQFNAGQLYYREMGMGAERDESKGVKWFLTYLKVAKRRGTDLSGSNPRTAVRAVEEFLSRANQEDIGKLDREVMLLLCECYREGIGLKKDAKEADKWYRMAVNAARQGNGVGK